MLRRQGPRPHLTGGEPLRPPAPAHSCRERPTFSFAHSALGTNCTAPGPRRRFRRPCGCAGTGMVVKSIASWALCAAAFPLLTLDAFAPAAGPARLARRGAAAGPASRRTSLALAPARARCKLSAPADAWSRTQARAPGVSRRRCAQASRPGARSTCRCRPRRWW